MNKDTFKRYFLILLMAVAGCQSEQKRQETTSSDEALIFAKNIFGDKVKIAVRGDLNSNNKKDALALVINRQIDEMKFWIQKGGVVEKNDDTWKVLLRIDEKVYNSAGPIKEIPESKDGYIL